MRLISDEEYSRLKASFDAWDKVRGMLSREGCCFVGNDIESVRAALQKWLNGVQAMRCFRADGTPGILVEDVLRQVEEASKAGDSSLLECAAIVIRRLMEKAVPDAPHVVKEYRQ